MKKLYIALIVIVAITITSSTLFILQGGFGAGHGSFDLAIFLLGLPWAAMPWPDAFVKRDFVWLIGIPFILNLSLVLIVAGAVMLRRKSAH